jgi:hypothetical protein
MDRTREYARQGDWVRQCRSKPLSQRLGGRLERKKEKEEGTNVEVIVPLNLARLELDDRSEAGREEEGEAEGASVEGDEDGGVADEVNLGGERVDDGI